MPATPRGNPRRAPPWLRASHAGARGWHPGLGSRAAHLRGRAFSAGGPRVPSGSRPPEHPSIRAAPPRPPPPPPLPASPFPALQAAEAAARVGRGASYPRATPRTLPTREPKAALDLPGCFPTRSPPPSVRNQWLGRRLVTSLARRRGREAHVMHPSFV